MMDNVINVPILIIGFNRPEVSKQTFSFIREAKPSKLYIAIDGAREHVTGEKELVEKVKNVFSGIDWRCDVHCHFNDENKGAEVTVSSAISWVLDKEEYVIVLEDDIIAPLSFLCFAQEMLYRYENVENIFQISGLQITPPPVEIIGNHDYTFVMHGHTGGGWATWRRAWQKFSLNLDVSDSPIQLSHLKNMFITEKEVDFCKNNILKMKQKGIGNNSWDRCWNYIRLKEYGLSIIPRINLTSNIGVYGLHASGETMIHNMAFDSEFEVRNYPKIVSHNKAYDKYHFDNYLYHSLPARILSKAGSIIRKFMRSL